MAAAAIAGLASVSLASTGPQGERSFGDPFHYTTHRNLANLTANPDCTLTVPANPLTAQGLATPYVLNSAGATCAEDENTGAFVQATILNPATGAVSVYDPEVVVPGETGAPVPPVPTLPANAVVGIWTGFNGNQLKLIGPGAGGFANFAQQSYDHSRALFAALRLAVGEGRLKVPAIGTGTDGMACPTTRDASVTDQDPNDNVPVTYTYGTGASNGSDEQLVNLIQHALGCSEWTVPLLDPAVAVGAGNGTSTSGILQELQAAKDQKAPVQLVPGNDEFTTSDGNFVAPNGDGVYDEGRNNLYRAEVDQPPAFSNQTQQFCVNLEGGAVRLGQDQALDAAQSAPAFAEIGTNLANVLAGRFVATWQLLNCQGLTGLASPIGVTVNGAGLVSAATYPSSVTPTMTPTTTAPTTTPPTTTAPTTPPATTGTAALVQESQSVNPGPLPGEGPINSDGAAPTTPVFTKPVQAGDLVVMWATINDSNNSATFPLQLTGPNAAGWTLVKGTGGPFNWTGLWYKANVTAGEGLPQVTDPTGGNGVASDYLDAQAAEFSGATALDSSGAGVVPDGTAVKAAAADAGADLVVGVGTWNGANNGPTVSLKLTGGSGADLGATVASGDGSADFPMGAPFWAFGYGLSSHGTSPDTVTGTASQFENDGDLIVASFR